jgi:hypothetical protein
MLKELEKKEKRIENHLKIMAISLAVSAVIIFIVSNI